MKLFLATMLFALVSNVAMASEGGTGLTQPGDYYNPDYKCSMAGGVTLYVTTATTLKVSATYYSAKANKVYNEYLSVKGPFTQDKYYKAVMNIGRTFNIHFIKGGIMASEEDHSGLVKCEDSGVDGNTGDTAP